jgi:hypothetical protein
MNTGGVDLEIKKIVWARIKAKQVTPAAWIITQFLAKHPVVYDPSKIGTRKCDSSYAELARYQFAKDRVRHVLSLFKKTDSDLPTMPGFEHLFKAYSVNRPDSDDKESEAPSIVPIDKLSDAELLARADELQSMGEANIAHAEEIRRYVADRKLKAMA